MQNAARTLALSAGAGAGAAQHVEHVSLPLRAAVSAVMMATPRAGADRTRVHVKCECELKKINDVDQCVARVLSRFLFRAATTGGTSTLHSVRA